MEIEIGGPSPNSFEKKIKGLWKQSIFNFSYPAKNFSILQMQTKPLKILREELFLWKKFQFFSQKYSDLTLFEMTLIPNNTLNYT